MRSGNKSNVCDNISEGDGGFLDMFLRDGVAFDLPVFIDFDAAQMPRDIFEPRKRAGRKLKLHDVTGRSEQPLQRKPDPGYGRIRHAHQESGEKIAREKTDK